MVVRLWRLTGAVTLFLLFALSLPACSGQQQQEEGLDVTSEENEQYAQNEEAEGQDDQGQYQENQQQSNYDSQYEEDSEQTEEEGQYASYQSEEYTENNSSEGEYASQTNETENDLQEIIQEMNGQQGNAMADDSMMSSEDPAADAPVDGMMATDSGMSAEMGMASADTAGMGATDMGATDMAAAEMSTPLPALPGGTPAGPALPEMGSKMAYIVQKGDTLAKIAGRIYGDVSRWNEMATLSGLANPSRIYPGDLVYYTLEDSSLAFATAYESIGRSEEQVQPGDTLATIAQRVYGDSTAWRSIWRQNDNIDNPDIVPPGTIVYYISQQGLAKEVKKVRAQLKMLAQIKAKKQRQHGFVLEQGQKSHEDSSKTDAFDAVDFDGQLTDAFGIVTFDDTKLDA